MALLLPLSAVALAPAAQPSRTARPGEPSSALPASTLLPVDVVRLSARHGELVPGASTPPGDHAALLGLPVPPRALRPAREALPGGALQAKLDLVVSSLRPEPLRSAPFPPSGVSVPSAPKTPVAGAETSSKPRVPRFDSPAPPLAAPSAPLPPSPRAALLGLRGWAAAQARVESPHRPPPPEARDLGPLARPSEGALEPEPRQGPAKRRAPAAPSLRESLAALKEGLTRVEAEGEPVTRTLGFRALQREAAPDALEPEHLERPEEREWAKELLQAVRTGEARTQLGLGDEARADLGLLLHLEQLREARAQAAQLREAALHAQREHRSGADRLAREEARLRRQAQTLARPRSTQVVLGVSLALVGALALGGLFASGLGSRLGVTGCALLVLAGAWLSLAPWQRRAWVQRRLAELAALQKSQAAREAEDAERLVRARKCFEDVDAECQREEAAALAVFLRRPGAQRYLRLTGPAVAFAPPAR